MLDPWHPSKPFTPLEDTPPKKRHGKFRYLTALLWLFCIAVAFGAGAWWKH